MDERSRLAQVGFDDLDSHTLYICGSECRVLWWWLYQWHASGSHSLAIPPWYRYRVRHSTRGLYLWLTEMQR